MTRLARTDLAVQSRQLLHQAIWCGVVFGLVVLLFALNALPPIEVRYLVSGKVIATPLRVEALRLNLAQQKNADDQDARLQKLTLLVNNSPKQLHHFDLKQDVVLLGLSSVWHSRCNHDQFHNWIGSIATNSEPQRAVSSTVTSKELRVTRWEYEAARHYQAHHEFLADSISTAPETQTVPEKGVFQLASTGNSSTQHPSAHINPAQIKKELALSVQELQSRLDSLTQKSLAEQNQVAGQIELTDGPKIEPYSKPIPVWMTLSVLVLGLAAGSSAGWLQLRLQSGGVYDARDVAAQLSRAGLPEVAHVELSPDQLDANDWIDLASQKAGIAGRTSGRNLVLLSESMLAVWFAIIVGRLCIDPLWRGLLFDSPLAALGRLLSGMP